MTRPKPTHNRYVWRFWVENVTRGWKMDAYEGQTFDPAKPVQLLDTASLGWGFESDTMPGQLEPSTGTFLVGAPSVADLPDLFIGDLLFIWLYRVAPTGGTLDYYFELPCRVTDVVALADPASKYPIAARVYVSDAKTDLANRTYPGGRSDSWEYWPWGPNERLVDLAAKCQFNIAIPVTWDYDRSDVPPDDLPPMDDVDPSGQSALDLIRSMFSTAPLDGKTWVLREFYGWPGSPFFVTYRNNPADPITYMLVPLEDHVLYDKNPIAELSRTGNGPVELTIRPNASSVGDSLVIPACAVTAPTELRRDRRNQITDLSMQVGGIGDPSRTLNYAAIAAPVRVEHSLDGQTYLTDLPLNDEWEGNIARNVVEAWRPWLGGGESWSLPDLDIYADLLTDAELNNLVTRFAPSKANTGPDSMQVPTLTLTGLDPAIRPSGHMHMGAVSRVTFNLTRGQLVITVRPTPIVLPLEDTPSNLTAWADIATLGTAPGPSWDQAPGLTWADLRHTGET